VEQHLAQLQPRLDVFGLEAEDLPVDPLGLRGISPQKRVPCLEQAPIPF